jgi:DNA-binding transcriptional LysR family regulator
VRGEEVCLRLAQDEAMPYQPVLNSLEALARAFPLLEVQLASGAQGDVARKLLERRADLGLLFHHEDMPAALERQRLGTIELVTVCGAGHPLAALGQVDRRELARHRQLLMAPQDSHYPGGEQLSPAVWRADSFYAMAELLMRNLGWAWLPRHVVQYPTYQGQLVELSCDWTPPPLLVELVCRRDEALGPAALWLAEAFAEHLQAMG